MKNKEDSENTAITLHYFLNNPELHSVNAFVYNECERNMLLSLKALEKYIGVEIKAEVEAKKKGGLTAPYILMFIGTVAAPFAYKLIEAWIANFFRPKIHATEETLNRIEIIEKVKSGSYTQEEFDYLALHDKELMRFKSNYYKSASKETSITKIESSISDQPAVSISYNEFHLNIIDNTPTIKKEPKLNVTIYIASPILVKIPSSKQKWKGIYSGTPIDFSIEDNAFLKQVESKKVTFEYGTKIGCNIEIITKSKYDEAGEYIEECAYVVKDVLSWDDDKNFSYETKRYKKIKELENMPKLFSDEEMNVPW